MKNRKMNNRRISVVILALLSVVLFGGIVKADESANWGALKVEIRLEGKQLNSSLGIIKHDFYYPGALDGIDSHDIEQTLFDPDKSGGFADIEGRKITDEFSANSSRTAKHIKGFYKGTILPGEEPNIVAEFTWLFAEPTEGRFGDMPLILTQEDSGGINDPNGYRGDVRAEMANSGTPDFASIPLGKAPAGTYTENGPYVVQLRLDFEKPLADLDNDYLVNFKDFVVIAKYWQHEGRCIADITGPDGIPDGYVDMYDLSVMAGEWLDEE